MKNANGNLNKTAENYVLTWIKDEHPEWVEEDGSCKRCNEYYRILDKLVNYENIYN